MPGMTRIWERLFVGSRSDAEQLYRANPHHIHPVITLTQDWLLRRSLKLSYIHVPLPDGSAITAFQMNSVIQAIATSVPKGRILIHCDAGVSRAPVMAAAWMHLVGYRNLDEALGQISKLREIVSPSPTLLRSVKQHLQ